jgi:Trk-type K+ transport system membrane component
MLFYTLLLLTIVLIILIVVKLGSIAFQFTGMEPKMAMFQSLSAFTNTGFTTSASEHVVQHRTRRLIATILIIAGYIGIVGVIVTLIRSYAVESGNWMPTLVRLDLTLVSVYAIYFLFMISPPGKKLGERFARYREQKNKDELM